MNYPKSLSEARQEIDTARGKAYESENVATCITLLARDINRWAVGKGFWEFDTGDTIEERLIPTAHYLVKATKLMLVVTELAEGVEGIRKSAGCSFDDGVNIFTNEEEEITDAIIRLLDYAGEYRLRIGEAINAKMAHNEGRPHRHGKGF